MFPFCLTPKPKFHRLFFRLSLFPLYRFVDREMILYLDMEHTYSARLVARGHLMQEYTRVKKDAYTFLDELLHSAQDNSSEVPAL